MAGGRLAGPMKPYQTEASKPAKPDSAMVGTSGKMGLRAALVGNVRQLDARRALEQRDGQVRR